MAAKDLVRDVPKEEAKKLLADDLSDREIQPEDPQMGFSFEEGVNHCGSKAALMKTIRIFYRTIDSKANKIEQCLKEGLIGDYVIGQRKERDGSCRLTVHLSVPLFLRIWQMRSLTITESSW